MVGTAWRQDSIAALTTRKARSFARDQPGLVRHQRRSRHSAWAVLHCRLAAVEHGECSLVYRLKELVNEGEVPDFLIDCSHDK